MKVKKAIITAAGLGTRFLPITKAVPKPMLPVMDTPAIQYIMDEIKRAGIDEWVRFPQDCGIDILERVHTDIYGVTFVLCSEWITETEEKMREIPLDSDIEAVFEAEEYEEINDEYLEYSFLLLYKNGWIATPAKRTLAELYEEITVITERNVHKENAGKENDKQAYSLFCKYRKRNEERD